jgi:hypothetical protein
VRGLAMTKGWLAVGLLAGAVGAAGCNALVGWDGSYTSESLGADGGDGGGPVSTSPESGLHDGTTSTTDAPADHAGDHTGSGSGGDGETGTQAETGTGETSVPCTPSSCAQGCCGSDGACHTSSNATCGTGGGSCTPCGTAEACTDGSCAPTCDSTSCPLGCCDGNGACVTATTDGQCGTNGAACGGCTGSNHCVSGSCGCASSTDCPTGQACDPGAHACTNVCATSSGTLECNGGCCDVAGTKLCVAGAGEAACGTGGGACSSCVGASGGTACVSAKCGCTVPGDCPGGQACDTSTHTCSTSCTGGLACNGGCCDGTTCRAGTSDYGACGTGGGSCSACAAGQACSGGSCGTTCSTSSACNGSGIGCCGNTCTDTTTTQNCGTCGNACPTNETCGGTQCTCSAPSAMCNGVCQDLATDPNNCGACGHGCLGAACSSGMCQPITIANVTTGYMGLAIDANNVYWTGYDSAATRSTISSCPLGGCTTPTVLYSQNADDFYSDIALDGAGTVFWISDLNPQVVQSISTGGLNYRAYPVPSESYTPGLAYDGGNLYYAGEYQPLVRYTVSTASSTNVIDGNVIQGSWGITVDATNVYVADTHQGKVYACGKTSTCGTSPTVILTASWPRNIASTGSALYIAVNGDPTNNDVGGGLYSCPMSGCAANATPMAATTGAEAIAVDGQYVYWTVVNALYKCPLAGCGSGGPQQVTATPGIVDNITTDTSYVYYVAQSGGVYKVAK